MIDILNIVQDLFVVILAPIVGYVLKFFFKPSKNEIRVISQILAFLIGIAIKWASKNKDNNIHLKNIYQEVVKLKQKLNSKVELG